MLPAPILCKITSAATGAGYYNARRQIRKRSPVFDPTTSLTMATYYQDRKAADDVYVENSGAPLTVGAYVWCIVAGPSTASSPRIVLSVLGGGGGIFPVALSKTGGSNGNKTTAATWTYTVSTLAGTSIGTSKSPQRPRPLGTAVAGTLGSAYYDNSGVLQLYEALEKYGTGGC